MYLYSIILVDDEDSTHELLKNYIENIIGGFKVVGCFKNGGEAIDFLEENSVNIVITDIKMPKVSGLELAKYIYENMPSVKVVIISGYSEFEYVKPAIAYNVSNYLLKAVDMRELTDVLKKLASELDAEKKNIGEAEYMTQREGFCTDLIVGVLEKEEIEEEYKKCNIPYSVDNVKIALFKCTLLNYTRQFNERWNYDIETFDDAIRGILQSVINEYNGGVVIEINKLSDGLIIAVMTDFVISGIEEKLEENLTEIMEIDCRIEKIMDFCGIYDVENYANIFNKNELYKIMISYVKMYGVKRAKKVISRVMMLMNNEDPTGTKLTIVDNNGNVVEDEMYNAIGTRPKKEELIQNAKNYIHENYMEDISYIDVADALYFNGVYFSRFFRQQTGQTIGDYILETRMKKAIEYLKANMKIADISELCGYKNTRTFQRIFKNYTGYSAIDYKKIVLKNS